VFQGDSPRVLASKFCKDFSLDDETQDMLVIQLTEKINKVTK
jgi:hypothetical protein